MHSNLKTELKRRKKKHGKGGGHNLAKMNLGLSALLKLCHVLKVNSYIKFKVNHFEKADLDKKVNQG
jgi:hypothetical protein